MRRRSEQDREGIPASRRAEEEVGDETKRSTREQGDDVDQRVPKGDAVTGGGGDMTRGPTRVLE